MFACLLACLSSVHTGLTHMAPAPEEGCEATKIYDFGRFTKPTKRPDFDIFGHRRKYGIRHDCCRAPIEIPGAR